MKKKPVKNLNMHITWEKKNTVLNYVCVSVHSGVVKLSILREMFQLMHPSGLWSWFQS